MEYENIIKYSSIIGILFSLYALFFLPFGLGNYGGDLLSPGYTIVLLVMFLLTFFYMNFNSENKERYYKFALICFALYNLEIFIYNMSSFIFVAEGIYFGVAIVTLAEVYLIYRLYAKKFNNERNTALYIIGLDLLRTLMWFICWCIGYPYYFNHFFFFLIYFIITILAIGVVCLHHEEFAIDYDTAQINIDSVLAEVANFDTEESVRALAKENINDQGALNKVKTTPARSTASTSSTSTRSSIYSGTYTGKRNYARQFKNYWDNDNMAQAVLEYVQWDEDEDAEKDFNYMCATIVANGLMDNLKLEGAKDFLKLAYLSKETNLDLFTSGDKSLNDWFLRMAVAVVEVEEKKQNK